MKYGVIMHKSTKNFGDDVQTYAAYKLLPQVDYVIDREHVDAFCSDQNEPVAVPMAHWWFTKKWNWPPAECIIPKLISMHISTYGVKDGSSPLTDEWLSGLGGEYLKAYGPVGCRDDTTRNFLKERGFDCYFSGCITLTLPRQAETKEAGSYVVLVDLPPAIARKAKKLLKKANLKTVEVSHHCNYEKEAFDFQKRMDIVEERLKLYQNARCVITRRLHVSLPCLAMEVPVLSIVDMKNKRNYTRWSPYSEWLHFASEEDFLAGKFEFDFVNPPKNKTDYLETRNALLDEINGFISAVQEDTGREKKKISYTEEEVLKWQNQLMKNTLDMWLTENRKIVRRKIGVKESVRMTKRTIRAALKKRLYR